MEVGVRFGLGNRLTAMLTASLLKRHTARVVWNPDPRECPCDATEVIDVRAWPFAVGRGEMGGPQVHTPTTEAELPVRFQAWNRFARAPLEFFFHSQF